VHEEWLLHSVKHFDPAPADLTNYETRTIQGFNWWRIEDLVATGDTVFPPRLGRRLAALLEGGVHSAPIDITE